MSPKKPLKPNKITADVARKLANKQLSSGSVENLLKVAIISIKKRRKQK